MKALIRFVTAPRRFLVGIMGESNWGQLSPLEQAIVGAGAAVPLVGPIAVTVILLVGRAVQSRRATAVLLVLALMAGLTLGFGAMAIIVSRALIGARRTDGSSRRK